jgi:hypothetical protein
MAALRSQWGTLNEALIAKLYPVTHVYGDNGDYWQRTPDSDSVEAPIADASLDASLQWTSPFEAVGAENKLPLIAGLLQSGSLQSALSALASFVPGEVVDKASQLLSKQGLPSTLRQFEGVSGITQLNSTQIFNGMRPLSMQLTMIFRAWQDPNQEVQKPIDQLMQWALPQELSKQGFLVNFGQTHNLVRSLFPSKAPQILGFQYAGQAILPVVIEDVGLPMTVPRDPNGNRLRTALQLKISTLAAIDAAGWKGYYQSRLSNG